MATSQKLKLAYGPYPGINKHLSVLPCQMWRFCFTTGHYGLSPHAFCIGWVNEHPPLWQTQAPLPPLSLRGVPRPPKPRFVRFSWIPFTNPLLCPLSQPDESSWQNMKKKRERSPWATTLSVEVCVASVWSPEQLSMFTFLTLKLSKARTPIHVNPSETSTVIIGYCLLTKWSEEHSV